MDLSSKLLVVDAADGGIGQHEVGTMVVQRVVSAP
jgi:hypothetical protein